jgi:2-dehydro-3-deoxygluconokinase
LATRQLVTLGEAMLRLSVRPGELLEDAPAFDVHVGGSEANVAYAAARVGLRAAWVSALPDNVLGRRVARTLAAGGVDTSLVRWEKAGRLGLFFLELGVAPRPTEVLYDRANSTMALASAGEFDLEALADTQFLHVSGITLALSDSSRELTRRAMAHAKKRGASVTMDVNYRQRLWSRVAAADAIRGVTPHVDVLVCTAEDGRDLFGADDPSVLQAALGVATVVVTRGAQGAIASHDGTTVERGGHAVDMVDRIGAGDAFTAGLLWGLLDGSLELGLERGLAMSALKMTLRGDLFGFDADDVAALMAKDRREVGR